jgi:hypothetical protein
LEGIDLLQMEIINKCTQANNVITMGYPSPILSLLELSEIAIIARSFTSPIPIPNARSSVKETDMDKRKEIFPRPSIRRKPMAKMDKTFR